MLSIFSHSVNIEQERKREGERKRERERAKKGEKEKKREKIYKEYRSVIPNFSRLTNNERYIYI